jgi:hypothetical protein
MVIVATREASEVPAHMKQWLDAWTRQRSSDEGALVAILNRGGKKVNRVASPVRDHLAGLAEQMHMDFFSSEIAS